jgi:hypothetical protein
MQRRGRDAPFTHQLSGEGYTSIESCGNFI